MTGGHDKKNEMELQTKKIQENLGKIKNKILIFSGKGGVGKSTIAASIAYKLSLEGFKTGLLDVDLHGPSIPILMGVKDKKVYVGEDQLLRPIKINENLFVLSIEAILEDTDTALIWRGPMKIGVIRQFIADTKWDELDYLIVDSPPGTGDEPLTVAQDITGSKSIIVTTPQEIALSDVRKSIDFCHKVGMPIIGIVENMSSFICPKCNEKIDLFQGQGSQSLHEKFGVNILGEIPFYNNIIPLFDAGKIKEIFNDDKGEYNKKISNIVSQIINCSNNKTKNNGGNVNMKIGITLSEDNGLESRISEHFGQCQFFLIATIEDNKITESKVVPNNAIHGGGGCKAVDEISQYSIDYVIAGGMGMGAQQKFAAAGIKVFGHYGIAKEGIEKLLKDELGGLEACKGHHH